MSAIRKGDHVHVEFDAYVYDDPDEVTIPVRYAVDIAGYCSEVSPGVCTKIASPIKVGDKVDGNNIQQLPEFSIIASDNGAAWIKRAGMWHFGEATMLHHEVVIRGDQRVLRIGGEPS